MAVNYERGTVMKTIDTITYDMDGSISSAILYLQRIQERNPNAHIKYDLTDKYSDHYGFVVYDYIPETDSEWKARVAREESLHKNAEKREREQLAALQAKYGK